MPRNSIITATLLGAIALVSIGFGVDTPILAFEPQKTIVIGATNILIVYFILALLIERACEVAMDLLTGLGAVAPEEPETPDVKKPERRMASVLLCLVFATAISGTGLRLVEMILATASIGEFQADNAFRWIDMTLTALILAGGSDGVHQIIRSLPGGSKPAAVNR